MIDGQKGNVVEISDLLQRVREPDLQRVIQFRLKLLSSNTHPFIRVGLPELIGSHQFSKDSGPKSIGNKFKIFSVPGK